MTTSLEGTKDVSHHVQALNILILQQRWTKYSCVKPHSMTASDRICRSVMARTVQQVANNQKKTYSSES